MKNNLGGGALEVGDAGDSAPPVANDFLLNKIYESTHGRDRDGGFSRKNTRAVERSIRLDDLIDQEVAALMLQLSNVALDAHGFDLGVSKFEARGMEIQQKLHERLDVVTDRIGMRDFIGTAHYDDSEEPEEPKDKEVIAPARPRYVKAKMFDEPMSVCIGAGPGPRSIQLDAIYSYALTSETALEDVIWEFLTRKDKLEIKLTSQVNKLARLEGKMTHLSQEHNWAINSVNDRFEGLEVD